MRNDVRALPHYVYTFWADDVCLYVGCTWQIATRLANHAATRHWWPEITAIRADVYPTRATARRQESRLIAELAPTHNRNGGAGGSESELDSRPQSPVWEGPGDPNLLGAAEVARRFDIDRSTLSRWVAGGIITHAHKMPGKRGPYVFTTDEVERVARKRDTG